jgi:hypothetical protein
MQNKRKNKRFLLPIIILMYGLVLVVIFSIPTSAALSNDRKPYTSGEVIKPEVRVIMRGMQAD